MKIMRAARGEMCHAQLADYAMKARSEDAIEG